MEKKIVSIIADKLGKKENELKLESRLVEDLGADSLDLVELVIACEDEFKISLPDEVIKSFKTIGDIINYLKAMKK